MNLTLKLYFLTKELHIFLSVSFLSPQKYINLKGRSIKILSNKD